MQLALALEKYPLLNLTKIIKINHYMRLKELNCCELNTERHRFTKENIETFTKNHLF